MLDKIQGCDWWLLCLKGRKVYDRRGERLESHEIITEEESEAAARLIAEKNGFACDRINYMPFAETMQIIY